MVQDCRLYSPSPSSSTLPLLSEFCLSIGTYSSSDIAIKLLNNLGIICVQTFTVLQVLFLNSLQRFVFYVNIITYVTAFVRMTKLYINIDKLLSLGFVAGQCGHTVPTV